MFNYIYNFSLIAVRLYIFVKGIGFILTGDTVTGIGHILIAGLMGALTMPWPEVKEPEEEQQNDKPKQ